MSIMDSLVDAWEGSLHWVLRHVPVETASNVGSFIVRTNVKFNRPEIIAGARRNLAIHRPGLSEKEIDAAVYRFLDNVGRFMSEFSVLKRIHAEGRVVFHGAAPVQAIHRKTPIVVIVLHTGNWEAWGLALMDAGLEIATFYQIPDRPSQRRIAVEARQEVGFRLLDPSPRGLRDAMALLKDNRMVAIFGDEARDGRTMAPLFGRPPHDRGNLALAARLARRAGAMVVIAHSERHDNCRFDMYASEPFAMPEENAGVLADVAFLNSRVEPIVLANLDRWYYLDDSIEPLDESAA